MKEEKMADQNPTSMDQTAEGNGTAQDQAVGTSHGFTGAIVGACCDLLYKYHECFNAHKWVQIVSLMASLAFLSAVSYLSFFK